MTFVQALRDRLERSLDLYLELSQSLSDDDLARTLPGLRSNSVGAQLWCVVGARESYARAVEGGTWAGFSCSLTGDDVKSVERVRDALERSGRRVLELAAEAGSFDEVRAGLLMDLLEHEAAHRGQLIRYLYGVPLAIPDGWRKAYALEPS